jgi:hypothetical protein
MTGIWTTGYAKLSLLFVIVSIRRSYARNMPA